MSDVKSQDPVSTILQYIRSRYTETPEIGIKQHILMFMLLLSLSLFFLKYAILFGRIVYVYISRVET